MRYYLIAGEASGDLHGSNLIRGLKAEDPDAEFRFWGGDLMGEASGESGHLVHHFRDDAVMGFSDVISSGGRLLRNLRSCKEDILGWGPDVVILIDYPGFNLRIAGFAHRHGIRVFYYIAPKTWASRPGRNRKLRRFVDRLFIVFPFEIPYFTQNRIPFTYKGNPLIDAIESAPMPRTVEGRYIAILAGSRKGEISRMLPVCVEVVKRMKSLEEYRDCRFVIAGAPARNADDYSLATQNGLEVRFGQTYSLLKHADAAIINSGTASLEAALIGCPQVVCWSTTPLTAFLARKVLHVLDRIKFISLGNLILDREAFRELIQEDFCVDKVTAELRRITEDVHVREAMEADYRAIREELGGTGASRAVASAMISQIKESR